MNSRAMPRLAAAALLLLSLTMAPRRASAQPPNTVVIQGRLENGGGDPITGTRAYRVRFYNQLTNGTLLGSAITGNTTLSSDGRFNIEVVPPTEVLSAANSWYELAIDTDGGGIGTGDVFGERVKVNSVPFSLVAATALDAPSGTLDEAYDASASGAGRQITADSGAVEILSTGGLNVQADANTAARFNVLSALSGGAIRLSLYHNAEGGQFDIRDDLVNLVAQGGSGGAGGFFDLYQSNGNRGVLLDGDRTDANGGGQVRVNNAAAGEVFFARQGNNNDGLVGVRSSTGTILFSATGTAGRDGFAAVNRDTDQNAATMEVTATNAGLLTVTNNANQRIAFLSDNTANSGFVGVNNTSGNVVSSMSTTGSGSTQSGVHTVANPVGQTIGRMQSVGNASNPAGLIDVFNSGTAPFSNAGLDGSNGEVFGNTKSFIVADPSRADRLIRYTSLEGPEAAIYARGHVALANGKAKVELPEHFASMASPGTITVTLTPRSAESKGLAAMNVTSAGFDVAELFAGAGSYEFDFVAYAVRRGYEERPVYLDAAERSRTHGRVANPFSEAVPAE